MRSHHDVIAYLDSAPEEQKALLKWLRTEIRRALPDSVESFESKMPVGFHRGEDRPRPTASLLSAGAFGFTVKERS